MPLDDVQVGGTTVNFRATTAIIDSGTTAIVLSNSDAASIHQVSISEPYTRTLRSSAVLFQAFLSF